MYYEQRKPNFKVSIVRPDYFSPGAYRETTIDTLEADDSNKKLIEYSYELGLESFDAPFSLRFVPYVVNTQGETMIDIIRVLDIVKIEEHGELKYLGVVEDTRYSARMAESGPDRTILVSGFGVGGLLDRFSMLLDQIILADAQTTVSSLETKVRALVSDLSAQYGENTTMTQVFEAIRSSFKAAMEKIGGFTPGTGVFKVVDEYLQFSEDAKKLKTKYPLALSVFSYGEVSLGAAWRNLVFKPFYEFFVRWDEPANKWLITLRPTPFSPAAWLGLKKTVLDPLRVEAFDCGYSSRDVKTWFFAYLAGGALDFERARALYQKTAIFKDSAKWALYGYRPLEAAFKYVDMAKLGDNQRVINVAPSSVKGDVGYSGSPSPLVGAVGDDALMADYAKKIYSWFRRADEMLTGSIDTMTVKDGPRVGERVVFNEVEFYVEHLRGSWRYGGKMLTTLTVTRGGVYNQGHNVAADESDANWWFKKAGKLGDRLELRRDR